jgi:hypothetical protein
MKRGIVGIFLFVLFVNVLGVLAVVAECSDSDGGNNIYVKGTSIFGDNRCTDSCYYNDQYVNECYCGTSGMGSMGYPCPNGCIDGACINEGVISCNSDEDCGKKTEERYCSQKDLCIKTVVPSCVHLTTSSTGYCSNLTNTNCSACFNGCMDGACINDSGCTDSDGGKDFYVKGSIKGSIGSGQGYDDVCVDSNFLNERYCSSDPSQFTYNFKCPNGCKDGACLTESTETCFDSDNGVDIYTKGYVKDSTGVHYDFCSDTKKIGEKVCRSGKMEIQYEDCPPDYGCKDGVCVLNSAKISEPKIIPNTKYCTDSDSGVDYYTLGNIQINYPEGNKWNGQDMCSGYNKEYVVEYLCKDFENTGTFFATDTYKCPKGCEDGRCISESGAISYIERIKLNEPFKITLKESKSLENNIKVQFIGIGPNSGVVLKFYLQSLYTDGIMSGIELQLEKEKKVEYGGYYIELLGLSGETATIIIGKNEMVKESVKCIFKNSDNEEKCYTAEQNSRSSCSGIATCANEVSGYSGEKITWKSSCGGYSSTKIDGVNEEIIFDCSKGESDIGKIKDKGFRYMYYQCYNGKEEKQGSESSCKSSETWQGYAKEACNNQCNEESGKCGVNSFSVHGDCYDDTIKDYALVSCENRDVQECCNEWAISNNIIIPECVGGWNIQYDKCYFSCKDGEEIISKEALICKDSCPLDGKCYQFGYRKSSKYCTDKGSFEEQLTGDKVCENNFECKSNVCVSGKCVSQGMIDRILAWFRNIFGKDE